MSNRDVIQIATDNVTLHRLIEASDGRGKFARVSKADLRSVLLDHNRLCKHVVTLGGGTVTPKGEN